MESKRIFLLVTIVLLCIFGVPLRIRRNDEDEEKRLFDAYIAQFNKTYGENDVEYEIRFGNFKNSLRLIEELNANNTKNGSDALYGLTAFSDLSRAEFAKIYLQPNKARIYGKLYGRNDGAAKSATRGNRSKRSKTIPLKLDWRIRGVISPVHNQKTCGACWAFSTVETVEAMNALKTGSLVELSVQEMIDCSRNGNHGCEGGDSCSLLQWLMDTKTHVTSQKFYPFTYRTGLCRSKSLKTGVKITNYTCDSFVGAEDAMVEKLTFHGPVAAAVNALNWQYYLGGIIQYHCSGDRLKLNHAVQVVGFDRTGPVPYYIVRNSWGPAFGDNGYLYIAIGNNVCGLASQVTSVDVA